MRRISSLPTAEYCPKVDKIGLDVETTQSARSTIFHAYCDTGKWPEDLRTLPEADIEEISKWKVPIPFVLKQGDVTHALQYKNAIRESRVALDSEFDPVDIPRDIPQNDIERLFPRVMICGHLDMAWVIGDLVIVCDIKSSIFAVSDRCESLQLHGYGLALATILKKPRYLTAIWDASDGRYYVNNRAIEVDGFEASDIRDRIRVAASERDGGFRTGSHCGSCWKRSSCPAHLVDVPEGEFKAILSGQAMEKDVREALVKLKQMRDLVERVDESAKAWIAQHGPVRSEDGKKWYRREMRSKTTLDTKAVCRALGVNALDDYKTEFEYAHHGWRNVD